MFAKGGLGRRDFFASAQKRASRQYQRPVFAIAIAIASGGTAGGSGMAATSRCAVAPAMGCYTACAAGFGATSRIGRLTAAATIASPMSAYHIQS